MQGNHKKKLQNKNFFLEYLYIRPLTWQKPLALLQAGPFTFRCAIGQNGTTIFKREGDGATPLATMRILSGFRKHITQPLPPCSIKLRALHPADGWCDAPTDANYNRPVLLPYPQSAETMYRMDSLYDIGFILDWNISSRRINCGSAIFLHLTTEDYKPTAGCITLIKRDMLRIMPYLTNQTKLVILP